MRLAGIERGIPVANCSTNSADRVLLTARSAPAGWPDVSGSGELKRRQIAAERRNRRRTAPPRNLRESWCTGADQKQARRLRNFGCNQHGDDIRPTAIPHHKMAHILKLDHIVEVAGERSDTGEDHVERVAQTGHWVAVIVLRLEKVYGHHNGNAGRQRIHQIRSPCISHASRPPRRNRPLGSKPRAVPVTMS